MNFIFPIQEIFSLCDKIFYSNILFIYSIDLFFSQKFTERIIFKEEIS
jgi:hypothetical protein